jgi:hypothetical protein
MASSDEAGVATLVYDYLLKKKKGHFSCANFSEEDKSESAGKGVSYYS